jgi:hypothetical protein
MELLKLHGFIMEFYNYVALGMETMKLHEFITELLQTTRPYYGSNKATWSL